MLLRSYLITAIMICFCAAAQDADRPNVIIITIDTLRADRMSCYDHDKPTTPRIDEFAEGATRYAFCYSPAPWTQPSVGSLMTGRYPSELGIGHEIGPISQDAEMLAELLRDNGYDTAAIISHVIINRGYQYDQGFDVFIEDDHMMHDGITSAKVTRSAIKLLEERAESTPQKPLFLWLHYFDPHYEYIEHEEFVIDAFPEYEGDVKSGKTERFFGDERFRLRSSDIRKMLALYDSEIAYTDYYVGKVLDKLRELQLFDDAIIVLHADHGEEFMEHGRLGHTRMVFNEVIHVPLLIKMPKQSDGEVVEEAVGLTDVRPTVLAALGIEGATPSVGVDLMTSEWRESDRPIFSETTIFQTQRTIVYGDYKFILNEKTGGKKLYNLTKDFGEQHNLRLAQPDLVTEYAAMLESFIEAMELFEFEKTEHEMSPEEAERLRALGYSDE